MNWMLKKFDELSLRELYAILHLRCRVFVVEQNCVYLDPDGKDEAAWHLIGIEDDELIAYARIFPPGLAYHDPSIGRVVTAPEKRRSGLGRELMDQSLKICEKLFGKTSITLSAQVYLMRFYESLGFFATSDEYLDDGIPHIKMTRKASW